MSSPIFDATFGTGRFKSEEPMTTDQSQATPADELRRQIMDPNIPKNEREWWAAQEIERLAALAPSPEPQNVRETPGEIARKLAVIELGVSDETFIGKIAAAIRAALAQSDAGPRETYDKIKGHAVTQSEMAKKRDYELIRNLEKETSEYANKIEQLTKERDEALDVCERLLKEKAAVTQSDAEPAADEEAADALRSEYKTYARQMNRRWAGVHGELIPDCPTDGVAARQGNGG